ncbi:bacterial peptide chain release factor 2 [Longilinea arvoryzae]|uniref:Peptide chain release factor 2 n=1 Tax=Longilinea arvoryzae TaxID=360412 RepID=A0A0S7BGZ4_9CHLR|nr:bacterial peptide chain release factor 2 [Longilinea arvoryzae]
MNSWCIFDLPGKEVEIASLQKKSEDPELWNDREHAQRIMKNLADLRDELEGWRKLENRITSSLELAELEDESLQPDLEAELEPIEKELEQRELSTLLAGPYDKGDALLTISSGAGGTESNDWAAMLQRMYLRWIERHNYEAEVLDLTEGEEAGIKSVTISVKGRLAYGYLHAEKGVHRLVRLSPFDSAHRRHTSFAQVEVLPEVTSETATVQINPEDLRIDVYRSAGAGGQNVQKNSTAVRITHLPTGLVVSCQNERSQMQNRESAMRVLQARLEDIAQQERDKELANLRGEYVKTEWGSQIRSYVLHPYQMVKDHRTEYEVGNAQAVLDGDLDGFIEAYLRWRLDPAKE